MTAFTAVAVLIAVASTGTLAWEHRAALRAGRRRLAAGLVRVRGGRHPRPFTIPHRRRTAGRHERTTA